MCNGPVGVGGRRIRAGIQATRQKHGDEILTVDRKQEEMTVSQSEMLSVYHLYAPFKTVLDENAAKWKAREFSTMV